MWWDETQRAHQETYAKRFQVHSTWNTTGLKSHRLNHGRKISYILLTLHLGTIRVKNQLDALFFNVFISLLYMFRATQCSSSGESIVSIHHLVYITVCRWLCGMQVREFLSERNSLTCIPDSHLHTVIYTRWRIDTIDSPDDEHCVARNM